MEMIRFNKKPTFYSTFKTSVNKSEYLTRANRKREPQKICSHN